MTSEKRKRTMGKANESKWLKEARDHFQKTGNYRPQDLERVLGDPRTSFEGKSADEIVAASKLSHRK
jgi:hypothetical protein